MRYQICHPKAPLDPRRLKLAVIADLDKHAPVVSLHDSELDAVYAVRRLYPDGVPILCPLDVGSGRAIVIGVLAKTELVPELSALAFSLFVVAIPETNFDRDTTRKGKQFDQKKWKPPVVKPDMATACEIEIRGSDLAAPIRTMAQVGYHQGRLAIRTDVDGFSMSIVFEDGAIQIARTPPSEPAATVAVDGTDGSGTAA
jgi:hypothetical protein